MESEILVLSGGALGGYIHLGILSSLNYWYNENIKIFIGSSVGAILSYFLIIGYSPTELYATLKDKELLYLKDLVSIFDNIKQEYNLLHSSNYKSSNEAKYMNLYDHTKIMDIIEEMSLKKIGIKASDLTLASLYDLFEKELIVTTCNFTKSSLEYFTKTSILQPSCLELLLMSSSVPLIFSPHKYNNELYIDAGVTCNYPLSYAIKTYPDKKIFGINIKGISYLNTISFMFGIGKISSEILEKIEMPENERKYFYDFNINASNYNLYSYKNSYTIEVFSDSNNYMSNNRKNRELLYRIGLDVSENINTFFDVIHEIVVIENNYLTIKNK